MPLKCLQGDETLYAFGHSDQGWATLKAENRRRKHLTMPCCGANVILRTSKLGTQFFAHARSGECVTAPETAEHLLAKDIIARAVLAAGWEAKTECAGQSFGNEDWIADVMAIKDRKRIAIEVQWSRQDREVTKLRQERYMRSGVTGLWLVRHTQNLVMENDTPMFRLRFQEEARAFLVMLPSPSFDTFLVNSHNKDDRRFWQQEVDLSTFVIGALSGALKFAPSIGRRMPVSVHTAPLECWRCRKETNIVIEIKFEIGKMLNGHPDITTTVYDFDEIYSCEDFLEAVFSPPLLKQHGIGQIKRRRSRTAGGEYLSNGCVHCDALQGRFYDHDHWHEAKPAYTVEAELSDRWANQLLNAYSEMFRWWFNEGQIT